MPTLKDTITILLERGNAMQTFWGFYISVSAGLLVFFGSAHRRPETFFAVAVAFLAFAYVNCDGMFDIAKQRQLFHAHLVAISRHETPAAAPLSGDELAKATELAKAVADISIPPSPRSVLRFHMLADVLVLAAIALLTFLPAKTPEVTHLSSITEYIKTA